MYRTVANRKPMIPKIKNSKFVSPNPLREVIVLAKMKKEGHWKYQRAASEGLKFAVFVKHSISPLKK
jgi:hypothetical protein